MDAAERLNRVKDLLRFIACGSVDDGKSTLIGRLLRVDALTTCRSAAAIGAQRHTGAISIRAAGRRPAGGARAGHHHRRRLPLFLDAAAALHRRRHAGPRAVHAQHGDGRLDRRPRGHPGRRDQGPAAADAPAQRHRGADGHPPHRARRQQDGPGRLREDRFAAIVERLCDVRRGARPQGRHVPFPSRPCTATTSSAECGDAVVPRTDAAWPSRDRPRRAEPRTSRSACRAVDQPRRGLPRLSPARSLGGSVRPGDEVVVLPSACGRASTRIVTYEGDLDRATAGQAVTLTLDRRDRCRPRRRHRCCRRAAAVTDQFAAHIVWMGDAPMLPGRPYLLRSAPRRRRRR